VLDKYRPNFHFTPESNWMNDPNGMVYFHGEYHLFYQHHPYGNQWGPMYWGHAVSPDLIHWEHYPIALAPDEHGTIFSGSAVVDWHDTSGFFGGQPGLVAIFTHHDRAPETDRKRERQSLAYSSDAGRSWTKYADNPVLVNESCPDFRDPKVFWHQPTGQWVMMLASGHTISIYNSPDLKNWTLASEFGQGEGCHVGVWECPDLFELPVNGDSTLTKWVMLVSLGRAYELSSGIQYFIGDFDGTTFVNSGSPEEVRWLDSGRDNYAGVTWSDIPAEDGRAIYIGWMSNWRYANKTPTGSWRGEMTIPRELTLETRNGELTLIQRPIREQTAIRQQVCAIQDCTIAEAQQQLSGIQLVSYEITAEFEFDSGVEEFGFKVRKSRSNETVIGYSPSSFDLKIDRTQSGDNSFDETFASVHTVQLKAGRNVKLQVFVDSSSVEVFANDGERVMTDLIFPEWEDQGVEVFARGEAIRLKSLEVFTLQKQ
jgi:fructan beta-fructosidase